MINITNSAAKILKLTQFQAFNFSRVASFNDFLLAKKHLDTAKPKLACLYFRANWNPLCDQADKDFEYLSNNYLDYEFIKIDLDQAPLAKGYFAVKCEPEFLLLRQGQEIIRQRGQNQRNLEQKLLKVIDFSKGLKISRKYDVYEEFHEQYAAEHKQLDQEVNYWAR